MYTLLKPIQVRQTLLDMNLHIFSKQDFERIFRIPAYSSKYFLETQVDQGLFLRLKRGIYALKTDLPCEEEIANALYKPSYISFEYALGFYHLIPEMSYTITSATTKPTRLFKTTKIFSYRTIKKEAFTGYTLNKLNNSFFLMAEKEKALIDYLYFVFLKKSHGLERFEIKGLDKKKIKKFSTLFANERFLEFVSKTLL